jgi:acylphosphatase
MNTYKLNITGKVQGVWYRKYVMQIAEILQYTGYVKNLNNGSVEVVINLETQSELESLISKLYEGSMFSKVDDISCQKIEDIIFDKFQKRF